MNDQLPLTAAEAVQKGKSLFDKGEYDSAIAAYTEAIRLDPTSADAPRSSRS
jgi:cytochrome c-type biogenesis protein CcmH/NrfG